jgi:hypothetical protein
MSLLRSRRFSLITRYSQDFRFSLFLCAFVSINALLSMLPHIIHTYIHSHALSNSIALDSLCILLRAIIGSTAMVLRGFVFVSGSCNAICTHPHLYHIANKRQPRTTLFTCSPSIVYHISSSNPIYFPNIPPSKIVTLNYSRHIG